MTLGVVIGLWAASVALTGLVGWRLGMVRGGLLAVQVIADDDARRLVALGIDPQTWLAAGKTRSSKVLPS